jgi:hypothetical protein
MAGQERRGVRGAGSSRAASSLAPIVGRSAVASGSATGTATRSTPSLPPSTRELHTRATYRNLLLRGLTPDEAANLTAYLAGIAVGDTQWTLAQINRLLFLREMNRTGEFAEPTEPQLH